MVGAWIVLSTGEDEAKRGNQAEESPAVATKLEMSAEGPKPKPRHIPAPPKSKPPPKKQPDGEAAAGGDGDPKKGAKPGGKLIACDEK